MELDDFKSAWQTLDRRLQIDNELKLHALRERTLDKARGSLRPLFLGQVVQILLGIPFILLATLLWISQPAHASSIVAGVLVQAYGVLAIIAAGVVLGQLGNLDYSQPVLGIQKQLLRAQLNRGCRALDFYAGFYMKGNKDGQLCEGRDEIHARTGAKCEVDEFRLLVPVARDDD